MPKKKARTCWSMGVELGRFKICLWDSKEKVINRLVNNFNLLQSEKIGKLVQKAYELGLKEGGKNAKNKSLHCC